MANDVSYFKIDGDNTTYTFNDPDDSYAAGASVTLSGQQQFAGVWVNATTLRFNIPLTKTVIGRSVTVSGTFLLRGSGATMQTIEIGTGMTVTATASVTGVAVSIVYDSAPAYAQANYTCAIQPNGLMLTFS